MRGQVWQEEIWGGGLDSGVGFATCRWVQTEAQGQGFEGGQDGPVGRELEPRAGFSELF